jgi:hypothetical protein
MFPKRITEFKILRSLKNVSRGIITNNKEKSQYPKKRKHIHIKKTSHSLRNIRYDLRKNKNFHILILYLIF